MTTTKLARSHGRIGLRLLFGLAVLFACLALAWMVLLPAVVSRLVRRRTGFGVQVQSLYANPFTATLQLRGLVVTNPPGFPRGDFIDVREFRADAHLWSLFGDRLVVDDAVLDVAQVAIVRNSQGDLNATLFRQGLAGSRAESTPAAAPAPSAQPADRRARGFLIKRLVIRCDRVVIADYSRRPAQVREANLHFSHTYENVTDARQIAAPMAEVLSPIAAVLGDLTPQAGSALRAAGDAAKETGRRTGAALKGFWEALEKSLKK
jgi:uncharacterized protein involved in outer membrane biogenesis